MSVPELDLDAEPRHLEMAPYRGLWDGVLRIAVSDWFAGIKNDGKPDEALVRWFDADAMGPGTFLWICSALDFNPDRVRAALNRGETYRALREAERRRGGASRAERGLQ